MSALVNRLVTGPGSGLYHPQISLQVSGRAGMSVRIAVGKAEQAAKQRRRERFGCAAAVQAAGVAEHDHADPVIGSQDHRGQEAGHDAVLPTVR